MPTTDEQKAKNKINNDKAKAKRIAKAEAEAEAEQSKARAASVLSNAVKRTLTTRKKAGSVLSSVLKRTAQQKAFLKEKAPIRSSVASALSTKIAGAKSKSPSKVSPSKVSPSKEAGMSPKRTSPVSEFDDVIGLTTQEYTLSETDFLKLNLIPVGDINKSFWGVDARAKEKEYMKELYDRGKKYGKGEFKYRWTGQDYINRKTRYYDYMIEGVSEFGGPFGRKWFLIVAGKGKNEMVFCKGQYNRPDDREKLYYATEGLREKPFSIPSITFKKVSAKNENLPRPDEFPIPQLRTTGR